MAAGRPQVVNGLVLASLALVACHRAAPSADPHGVAACRAAQWHDDGRIHIDGPGSFTFLDGDSLVLIVNDREWWRGVYDPCDTPRSFVTALRRAIPPTDSVLSAEALIGRAAVDRYRVGGKHPDALVIRTAPPPE